MSRRADELIRRRLYEISAGAERVYDLDDLQLVPHGHETPVKGPHDPGVLHSTLHVYFDGSDWPLHEDADRPASKRKAGLKDTPGKHGLTYNQAAEITGGLSWPSKMPGPAYSTPAKRCQMGVILHKLAKKDKSKKTVCGSCYALKGRYVFPSTQNAAERRFASLNHPQWAEAMATMIDHHSRSDRPGKEFNHAHFRWHDSGDLQSPEHLGNIAKVAELTPHVQHWLPTREYKHVEDYKRSGGKIPKNLTVRLSGHYTDHAPPRSHGLPVSSVSSGAKNTALSKDIRELGGKSCPAPGQGNQCRKCRHCWDPNVGHVVYHEH